MRASVFLFAAVFAVLAPALPAMDHPTPGLGESVSGARYATDAYPGFGNEDEVVKPERKEPRWLGFFFGPNRESADEQLAYCVELISAGDFSKAAKQLDALVREWPTAPEAAKAQQAYANLLLTKLGDYEEAFSAYRYLLDFYSLQCDYEKTADLLYKVAGLLKQEGKEVMFVRFENTVDVRRAYETCVLRAPGAKWVPEAMMTIAALREDEGKHEEAVKVYENLRSLHPASDEAKGSWVREAGARMTILRLCEYNRARCQDTADFLRLAVRSCRPSDLAQIGGYLESVKAWLEDEAYRSARFYDSKTRTRRSAIRAYESFLADYPESARADEVRARLDELKGTEP